MKTMAVGELKTHFSEILTAVQKGQSIAVGFGRNKRKIAVIVPYREYRTTHGRRLGLLQGKARFRVHADFKVADEEFLAS